MFLKKKNIISMIPYPSGKIHLGHTRNYIINDFYNRLNKIKETKSDMPLGWDSFGTPAENASIDNNMLPVEFLRSNIYFMKKQLNYNNFSINWKKTFKTFDKNYYYFTQKIILKILKNNLLFISNKKINWDGCDKTVLSNEQIIKGRGWRSSCIIKKKNILTYYIKIKKYITEVFNEIDNLNWPKKIKIMQKNWIFIFKFYQYLFFFNFKINFKKKIFLKNLFYIFFLNFFEKKIFFNINLKKNILKNFIKNFLFLKNFFKNKLEIWFFIKNKYFFFNYKNKFNFFFILKKKYIILKNILIYLNFKELYIFFKKKKIIFALNKVGIKDWGVSRQRYWGTPIPSFFCFFCKNYYTVLSKDLPYLICKNIKKNIYFYKKKINKIFCEICGKKSYKEIQTIDTFVDSSWYFIRYFLNRWEINKNMPVDTYIGGIEHSLLHLLYSRCFAKFFRDLKYINFGEPFKKLYSQGMILNRTDCKNNFFKIEKMSKSKNNFITPEKIILNYNLSSLRLTILKNSLDKDFIWRENFIKSSYIFLNKFYKSFFYNKFIKFKKERFFIEFKVKKNFKIILNFVEINFKKILFFFKKIKYNNFIYYFLKIFKVLKKNNFLKIINFFLLKNFFLKFLKISYPFLTILSSKLLNKLKYRKIRLKFFNINYFYEVYRKNIKKTLVLKNKIIGKIYNNKLIKKKILNFLFFKKKIKKSNIKKIILMNLIINISYF